MKRISALCIVLMGLGLMSLAQDNRPKATYRVGASSVSVWENEKDGQYGKFTVKDFKIEKRYKKDDQWKSTNYFSFEELLELRAAIDKAIAEEGVKMTSDKD